MIDNVEREETMSTWIVGDVHGHFTMLERLLEAIDHRPSDRLVFVGDLVNGGGRSADVVRWCAEHDAIVTLGNHDLHMLAVWSGARERRPRDDFHDLLDAPDAPELIEWLSGCPLTYHLPDFETLIVHAGVPPQWTVEMATSIGAEIEGVLQDGDARRMFDDMYGNKPARWKDELTGAKRMRCAINGLTRMRVVDTAGRMELEYSGEYGGIPAGYMAWWEHPERRTAETRIVFGHWAALGAKRWSDRVTSLDAGVRWGRKLAALRLDDDRMVKVSPKVLKPPKAARTAKASAPKVAKAGKPTKVAKAKKR